MLLRKLNFMGVSDAYHVPNSSPGRIVSTPEKVFAQGGVFFGLPHTFCRPVWFRAMADKNIIARIKALERSINESIIPALTEIKTVLGIDADESGDAMSDLHERVGALETAMKDQFRALTAHVTEGITCVHHRSAATFLFQV